MELKLIEVERRKAIYKYSQLENLTDSDVDILLRKGDIGIVLSGVNHVEEDCKYSINIDRKTQEVVVCNHEDSTIKARGIVNARQFMLDNDYGVIFDIIPLEW